MASFVNAADAVAAAVEIERRGREFYQRAAEKATNADDKAFFAYMADEEKRHEGVFSGMLERLGGAILPTGSNDEEYLMYVHALLDSNSLFLPGQEERILAAPLHEAVQFEKDTLVFFLELEQMVPDSERADVRRCADEERKHLRILLGRVRKSMENPSIA